MTLETFNPPVAPSPGSAQKPEIKILRADFGDGYTQSTPDGMNHIRKVYSLRWDVLTTAQANHIEGFLTNKGGAMPFLYKHARASDTIKVTCEEWERTEAAAGLCSFTAVFRQSFVIV